MVTEPVRRPTAESETPGRRDRLRILVHDFSGHPFQAQLSRELACRGHEVLHVYCADFLTPRGALATCDGDSEHLAIHALGRGAEFPKYSAFQRWRAEGAYGNDLAALIDRFRPDVVLSANTPLGAQARALPSAKRCGSRFVFWVQDLYGAGMAATLGHRIPVLGHAAGAYYVGLEGRLLRRSDAVVLISDDFRPAVQRFGVDANRIHVIENWAPLGEIPVTSKVNPQSRRLGLADKFTFLYAGTLGLKHDPGLLLRLARHFGDRAAVAVCSEGIGMERLQAAKRAEGLDNLLLHGFQDYDCLPYVLGGADVVVAILEPEAGAFSVPSKILTYLAAGRPLLASIPRANLAARLITETGAGRVVEPGDGEGFLRAADELYRDADARRVMAARGRRHAEAAFDIGAIGDRFETILYSEVAA